MAARLRARALGRNQFVDAGAQVLQHEILLGGRLAVVDLLGPLFQRQLDAELLVDRERDVQEIEAVDAEIIDGMAIRRDRVARDVAGFSDDRGDLIEDITKPLIYCGYLSDCPEWHGGWASRP